MICLPTIIVLNELFIYSFHRDIRQLNAEKLLQTHMDMYTDSHNSEITQVSL